MHAARPIGTRRWADESPARPQPPPRPTKVGNSSHSFPEWQLRAGGAHVDVDVGVGVDIAEAPPLPRFAPMSAGLSDSPQRP